MGLLRERKAQLVEQFTAESGGYKKHRLVYSVEAGTEFIARYLARKEVRMQFPTEAQIFTIEEFENMGDVAKSRQTTFEEIMPGRYNLEEYRITLVVLEDLHWWEN